MELHWQGPGTPTPIAANILHCKWNDNLNHSASDLTTLAARVSDSLASGNIYAQIATSWTKIGVLCVSVGGDGAQGSEGSPFPGTDASQSFPPNNAVCVSWTFTGAWRGGKPRTYVPGVPLDAVNTPGSAQLKPTYASNVRTTWLATLTLLNAITIGGVSPTFGFISYFHNYAFRPVPLFFNYGPPKVHERVDSQRRRSGKERYFPLAP